MSQMMINIRLNKTRSTKMMTFRIKLKRRKMKSTR